MIAMKMMKPPKEQFEEHYGEHRGKPFFEGLVKSAVAAPCVPMVWEGDDVIATSRKMIGVTNPSDAAMGTFRGDHGISRRMNSVHGSDSKESADREIALWFPGQSDLCNYSGVSEPWLYEKTISKPHLDADKPKESDDKAEKKEEVKVPEVKAPEVKAPEDKDDDERKESAAKDTEKKDDDKKDD